jgi:hypothetical protein
MIVGFCAVLVLIRITYSLAEICFERDWPRHTWRGLILSFALLVMCSSAFGQAARVDIPLLTSGPFVPITEQGALPQTLWMADSIVYVCTHPSATLAACQANPITTYTDSTEGTTCPSNVQMVQLPGNTCTASSGVTSNVGFWYGGGLVDYWVVSLYGNYGPFTVNPPYPAVSGCPTTGCTFTGPISAPITNNICIASNQGTTNAGTDIAACEAIISNGGTIDARGYTSASTINGLRISKPLTLMLGPGPFNVTGIIDAHDTQNVTIECSYTIMTGNTGAGNPVIDAMGVNDFKMSGCIIAQGQGATKSTIGLLQARTSAWQHVERTHLQDDLIVLQSDPTANGGCGTFALYNYGAEVTEYDHLYLTADRPFVLTDTNAWPSYAPAPVHASCGVTAPDVPFFTGNTTASSVTLGGQTNLISTYEAMILDGTFDFVANIGEASGSIIPGNNAIQMTQNNPNANISGEIEGYYRVINNVGQIEGSQFNMLCSLCQSSPFTGSLTTSAGSAIATPSTMVGLYPGQMITSANVPRGTLVNAVGTTTITMSTGTGVLAGTATATMGEPIITMTGSVQNSHFNIFDTGGVEANYIWSPNPAIVPSIGWSANLPANVDITWPTSSQSTAPIAGHWEIPYESGAATPIVSSNVQGSYCNPTGCSIVGDGILSGRSVSSTGQASSGSTVGKGGDYYMVGQSSWSQPSHLTTQDLANTGIAGTQLTRGGAAGTIALVLPDSGHGAQIIGTQAEWEGNYNPSYTYGNYGSVVAGSNGNYFTNTLAGDWVFYSATHRLVIGSGTGAGNIFTSSGVSIANALWLPSQETLSGYNCLQIDAIGNITKTGTACGSGAEPVPTTVLKTGSGLGNYSSTSTSLVNVDATNLSYTVTIPTGYRLVISANGNCFQGSTTAYADFALYDSYSSAVLSGSRRHVTAISAAGTTTTFSLQGVIAGDGNSHTINLQYLTSDATAAIIVTNGSTLLTPSIIFTLYQSN